MGKVYPVNCALRLPANSLVSVGVTSTASPVAPARPRCPVKYIDQGQLGSQGPMASADLSGGGGEGWRTAMGHYLQEIGTMDKHFTAER